MRHQPGVSSVNPPIPSQQSTNPGQRLLSLVRSLEKDNNSSKKGIEEAVLFLHELVAVVQRKGLLQGDARMAELVLSATANSTKNGNRGGGGKKGKHGQNRTKNDLTLLPADDSLLLTDQPNSNKSKPQETSAMLDSQLLVSAMARVLEARSNIDLEILTLMAHLCINSCEYLKSRSQPDSCFLAEYELLANHGKSFLTGLERHSQLLVSRILTNGIIVKDGINTSIMNNTLSACLRAATSLVSLFGAKLSRVGTIQGLRTVAFSVVGFNIEAATLLATLPFASSDSAAQWSRTLVECVDTATLFLNAIAPNIGRHTQQTRLSLPVGENSIWKEIDALWVAKIRTTEASEEPERVCLVLQILQNLMNLIEALLTRKAIGVAAATAAPIQVELVGATVNVETLLNLVETTFSTAAESKYFSTKKRLRHETITDGVLNPTSLVGKICNPLRGHGHSLLDTILSTLGSETLLPHARCIQRIVQSALMTSTSTALRKVLDPTSSSLENQKRPRWLHSAVVLRRIAIQSFQKALLAFGTDSRLVVDNSIGATRSSNRGVDTEKAFSIVCGTVVEELTSVWLPSFGGDWGTFEERVDLVATAVDCLTTGLNSGGEYLSSTVRTLLDSVVFTCLSVVQHGQHPIASHEKVKCSILVLSTACITTPWQDGASCCTSISINLKRVAQSCQKCCDSSAEAANTALQVCRALDCPRVPALSIITRAAPFSSLNTSQQSSSLLTVESVVDKLQTEREDLIRAVQDEEVRETKKHYEVKISKAVTVEDSGKKPRIPSLDTSSQPIENEIPTTIKPMIGSRSSVASTSVRNDTCDHVDDKQDFIGATLDIELKEEPDIQNRRVTGDEEVDEDDDFPMIVDTGPDVGDDE